MSKFLYILLLVGCSCAFLVSASDQNKNTNRYYMRNADKKQEQIKADLDRIFNYLNETTPANIVDKESGEAVTNYKKIDASSVLERGKFGINTYEWGVTYSGMLKIADITGDKRYADYTYERFKLIGESYPYFKKINDKTGNSGLRGLIEPNRQGRNHGPF